MEDGSRFDYVLAAGINEEEEDCSSDGTESICERDPKGIM